jgi:hypothetical protein
MMQKRKFTTPVWWMLILGIIATAISMGILHYLQSQGLRMRWLAKLSLFYLPVIMFVEAVMYWTIRRRISYRRDAWNHLVLFTVAYVFNYGVRALIMAIFILHSPIAMRIPLFMRVAPYGQLGLFWVLVIVAHIFFARVLIKAFAKPLVEEVVESGNLLDDVLD